jgi:hypothetical protein
VSEYTTPKTGEHVIAYACPHSATARLLGQQESGCFVVHLVGDAHAHATYKGCVEQVTTLDTRPARWSMDHPWNQHLYPHHDAIPEALAWHRLLAAEEAQRAAAAERTRALVAAGGHVSVTLDRTPLRTVITEAMHDAEGNGVAIRNAGEIWGDL